MANTTLKQDQQLRDKVNSIYQTQEQLILPALKDNTEAIKALASGGFITRKEVEDKFMTKEDFAPYKWVIMTMGGAILVGLGAALVKFALSGALVK